MNSLSQGVSHDADFAGIRANPNVATNVTVVKVTMMYLLTYVKQQVQPLEVC